MAPLPKRKLSKGRRDRRRNHDKITGIVKVEHKKVLGRKFSKKEASTNAR